MAKIIKIFGDFDVDTYASASKTVGKRFFSLLMVPGLAGVDFFHQGLDPRESHFCFPSPSKLVVALRHFRNQGVAAVMVVPAPDTTLLRVRSVGHQPQHVSPQILPHRHHQG